MLSVFRRGVPTTKYCGVLFIKPLWCNDARSSCCEQLMCHPVLAVRRSKSVGTQDGQCFLLYKHLSYPDSLRLRGPSQLISIG